MINDYLRKYIKDTVGKTVMFDNPSFDDSIIGTYDNHVVYDYATMIEELCKDNNCGWEDAVDYIESNVLGSISYTGDSYPIVEL